MNCLLNIAALLLGEDARKLEAELEIDVNVLLAGNPRGVHIDEIQSLFLKRGKGLVPVESKPCMRLPDETPILSIDPQSWNYIWPKVVDGSRTAIGIIISEQHAVIIQSGRVIDNGVVRPTGEYESKIDDLWIVF